MCRKCMKHLNMKLLNMMEEKYGPPHNREARKANKGRYFYSGRLHLCRFCFRLRKPWVDLTWLEPTGWDELQFEHQIHYARYLEGKNEASDRH